MNKEKVINSLEFFLKEAEEKADRKESGDIYAMLELAQGTQSENFYIREAHLLREVLQSLDHNWDFVPPDGCSVAQVYHFLSPIVREYERMAAEGQQAFEFGEIGGSDV